MFSYAVIPNVALKASALKDGTKLTTKNGETLAITVKG